MPTLRAVLVPSLATALLLPAGAQASTFSIKAPKRAALQSNVAISWTGDTRSYTPDLPNRVIRVIARRNRACPKRLPSEVPLWGRDAMMVNQNFVPHLGGFAGASQLRFGRSGKWTTCGYVSGREASDDFRRIGRTRTLTITRKRAGRRTPRRPGSGVYTATGSQITGGLPGTSLRLTVDGGRVTSVSVAGAPMTACHPEWAGDDERAPMTATSTGQDGVGATALASGTFLQARFTADNGGLMEITGSSSSTRRFAGTVTLTTDGRNCRGGFGFTARRS